MSPSPEPQSADPRGILDIQAGDSATEIFVIDGDLQLVDRGVGRLTTKPLPFGIYKVKSRAGFETQEQHVVLDSPQRRVVLEPFAFVSPAPLPDTGATHEYHMLAAERESRRVHVQAGAGSSIFVLAREYARGVTPLPNPAAGLSLCNNHGVVIADIARQGAADSSVPDPWGACTVAVTPGTYRLRTDLSDGSRFEQTIVAAAGWQTQVFILPKNTDSGRIPDVANAAMFMAPGVGFSHSRRSLREEELARLGLANQRKVVSEDIRSLMRAKCEDPMLGIFSAHLLFLESAAEVRDRTGRIITPGRAPDLDLIRTVVANTRSVLGAPHPDVEALALGAGLGSTYVFNDPPMLRRSWTFVLNATIDRPSIVPPDSVTAYAARAAWSEQPWLVWNARAVEEKDAVQAAFEIQVAAGVSRPSSREVDYEPFAEFRQKRAAARPPQAAAMPAQAPSPAPPPAPSTASAAVSAASDPTTEKITLLVKTLGLPRTNVERMLNAYSERTKRDAADPK